MKQFKIPWIISNIIIFFLGLYSVSSLTQKNSESLFLTEPAIQKYQVFQLSTGDMQLVQVVFEIKNNLQDISAFIDQLENNLIDFNFITYKKLFPSEISQKKYEASPHEINGVKWLTNNNLNLMIVGPNDSNQWNGLFDELIKSKKKFEISISGLPYINFHLNLSSAAIQNKVFPAFFLIAFIFCFLITKNLRNTLFIYLPALISSLLCLSLIKVIYQHLDMITAISPILIFAITLTTNIHLFFQYQFSQNKKETWIRKKIPLVLMNVTTMIGFATLYFSSFPAIKSFSVITTLSLIFSFLYTISHFFLFKINIHQDIYHKINFDSTKKKYPSLAILLILIAITGFMLISKIQIQTNAIDYFPAEYGIKDEMNNNIQVSGGLPILEIIIHGRNSKKRDELVQISEQEDSLKELINQSGYKVNIISKASLIKTANYTYTEINQIPEFDISISSLASQISPNLQTSYFTDDFYHFTILGHNYNSQEYTLFIKKLTSLLKSSPTFNNFEFTGLNYQLMISQKEMIKSILISFASSLFLIIFVASFYIRNLLQITIMLFVNFLPFGATIAFQYLFKIPFSISTVMTYSISLGLMVDATFHMIHSYRLNVPYFEHQRATIRAIIYSSFILVIAFSLLAFESFVPIKQFGLLMMISLFWGAAFDLIVMPVSEKFFNQSKEEN